MAMGKSISSPALASILSGEDSAISGAVESCTGCANPVELGGLAARPSAVRGRIVPCHDRTNNITVGTSATQTRAEIRPFMGRGGRFVAGEAAIVSGLGKPASLFSGAKRSASAAMFGFEKADRLTGSSNASRSPQVLGGGRNLESDLRSTDDRMTFS
jgi:hypothetical protein